MGKINKTCPECDEKLERNEKGILTNKKTGLAYAVLVCKQCDQAYTFEGEQIGILPFTSNMKPIIEICKTCGKEEYFRQKMIYIVNDHLRFEPYCPDCAVEFLRNWRRTLPDPDNKKIELINKENAQAVSDLHHMQLANEILSNPEKVEQLRKEYEPILKKHKK